MFDLYSLLLAASFVFGAMFVSVLFYSVARRALSHKTDEHSQDMASSIIFRIAALHGLILALVFAQELTNYNEVRKTVTEEAIAVGDVFFDLGRLDPDRTVKLRQALTSYAHAVVHDEWGRLGTGGGLSPAAWRYWETTYQGILDLEVEGKRDKALISLMLPRVRKIAGYRQMRVNAVSYGLNPLFWTVAIVGLLVVAVPYLIFPPTFMNLTLLSIFGGYTGLVMFAIAAVANPYLAPGELRAVGMSQLLKGEMANFYTGK